MEHKIIGTPFGNRHFYDVKQNTEEWKDLRAGIVTASGISRILTPAKLEFAKGRESYMDHLIGERHEGVALEFISAAMQEGKDREEESRKAFQLATGKKVEPGGFWTTEDGTFGASPDGLIGEDEGLELKNLNVANHVKYYRSKKIVEPEYYLQVQGNLLATGRKIWWFVSYYRTLPALILKIERDEKVLGLIEEYRNKFWTELVEAEKQFQTTEHAV